MEETLQGGDEVRGGDVHRVAGGSGGEEPTDGCLSVGGAVGRVGVDVCLSTSGGNGRDVLFPLSDIEVEVIVQGGEEVRGGGWRYWGRGTNRWLSICWRSTG